MTHSPPGLMGKYIFREWDQFCCRDICCVLPVNQACLKNNTVLFTSAIDAVNNLIAAQHTGQLKQELKKYLKPSLLIMDELGYLPIDKNGADLLFQIISERYERGSIIITTNRVFKEWVEIFNNDSTLTSALLDRLLHHTEAVIIEGDSYRMRKAVKE